MAPQALPLGKANLCPTDDLRVSRLTIKNEGKLCLKLWGSVSQCISSNLGLCHWTIPKRRLSVGEAGM